MTPDPVPPLCPALTEIVTTDGPDLAATAVTTLTSSVSFTVMVWGLLAVLSWLSPLVMAQAETAAPAPPPIRAPTRAPTAIGVALDFFFTGVGCANAAGTGCCGAVAAGSAGTVGSAGATGAASAAGSAGATGAASAAGSETDAAADSVGVVTAGWASFGVSSWGFLGASD